MLKTSSEELFATRFKSLLTEFRESAKKYPITIEEIRKEAETVRQGRYESRNWYQYMDQLFTPLEIIPRCSAARLDFRIIPAGLNAPMEFLTGFTWRPFTPFR